jgi:hypothetical protein
LYDVDLVIDDLAGFTEAVRVSRPSDGLVARAFNACLQGSRGLRSQSEKPVDHPGPVRT